MTMVPWRMDLQIARSYAARYRLANLLVEIDIAAALWGWPDGPCLAVDNVDDLSDIY
jgi:hypothetical protein